jgi:hypothetical protein
MKSTSGTDPSLTAGSTPATPQEALSPAAYEAISLLEQGADTAAMAVFLDRRTTELSLPAAETGVGSGSKGTDKFIGPEVNVELHYQPYLDRPHRLDDPQAYLASVPRIAEQFRQLQQRHPDMPREKAYLNAVLRGVNRGQIDYFESIWGNARGQKALMRDFFDADGELAPPASIAEFKRVARCQERAEVVHNTLLLFGIPSKLEIGTLRIRDAAGQRSEERHAFVITQDSSGNELLFDPTNPKLTKNEAGDIIEAEPSIQKLQLDENNQQTVVLPEYVFADGNRQKTKTTELLFTVERPNSSQELAGHIAVSNTT